MPNRLPRRINSSSRTSEAELESVPGWIRDLAQTLLAALRERDPYTYGHCRRVARYSRLLAEAAGLNPRTQTLIEYSSMFHDLGKMGIPDTILLKPGRLTDEEEEIMKLHPVKSVEILRPLMGHSFFESLIPGILHHHERVDGLGYPFGLAGEEIPLEARVILIADTYDAMTTTRPYRKGLPIERAYKELTQFSGRQFDPQLVQIFMSAHPGWALPEEEISEAFVSTRFRRPQKKAA